MNRNLILGWNALDSIPKYREAEFRRGLILLVGKIQAA